MQKRKRKSCRSEVLRGSRAQAEEPLIRSKGTSFILTVLLVQTWEPSCLIAFIFSVKYDVRLSAKVVGKKRKHCEIVIL